MFLLYWFSPLTENGSHPHCNVVCLIKVTVSNFLTRTWATAAAWELQTSSALLLGGSSLNSTSVSAFLQYTHSQFLSTSTQNFFFVSQLLFMIDVH